MALTKTMRGLAPTAALFCGLGLGVGALAGGSLAAADPPTEHAGLTVTKLGEIPPESVEATVGLKDHFLQLRLITIAPGGRIARHGHARRPGLVKVIEGSWIEGTPEGETAFAARDETAILEDEATVHWFRNDGATPATAVVCDLNPV